jgi:hypothetical protein
LIKERLITGRLIRQRSIAGRLIAGGGFDFPAGAPPVSGPAHRRTKTGAQGPAHKELDA